MTGAGIQHDDILVVDRSRQAEQNDIVIAVLDGELTVKRLVLDKGTARLILPMISKTMRGVRYGAWSPLLFINFDAF